MELQDLLIAAEANIQETIRLVDHILAIDHGDAKRKRVSHPNGKGNAKIRQSN